MLAGAFNIVILMGALQGFIISSLLFFSGKNKGANKLLAAFIFFIALACLNLFISGQKWATSGQVMPLITAVVPMVVVMPLGPLLYFYIKTSLHPGLVLSKKDKLHFVTVIIDLVPYLTALLFIITMLSGIFKHAPFDAGLFIDTYNVYADIPRWLSLSIYVVLSLRYLSSFSKSAAAAGMPDQLKWLKQLTMALSIFQTIWLLYLIPYVIPAYGDKLLALVYWYPIYVPMSVLIYWLGIKGYLVMHTQPVAVKKANQPLPDDDAARILSALKTAMEHDGLYLNPALNLNLLSQHTGIPQKSISAVLNQYEGKNFNEFVNGYRVDAFKQKVCADEVKHLTIAGIAAECGFNSQATFQRIFRQFTGLSPSEFKMQAVNSTETMLISGSDKC